MAAFSAAVSVSQSIASSVWFGNFGWGVARVASHRRTETEAFRASRLTGLPVSPPGAYQGGPVRAQGLASDANGNIWISSFGNNSLYVFLSGNPHQSVGLQDVETVPSTSPLPRMEPPGSVNGGGLAAHTPAALQKSRLSTALNSDFGAPLGRASRAVCRFPGETPGSLRRGQLVYALRPDGTQIGHFNGGGMSIPGIRRSMAKITYGSEISVLSSPRVISWAGSPNFGESTLPRATTWVIRYHRQRAIRYLRRAARCSCITAMPLYGPGQPPGPRVLSQ